jgi:hypothetical protein
MSSPSGDHDLQRTTLPIPPRDYVGLTTYDAKDPDTSFPPIKPVLPLSSVRPSGRNDRADDAAGEDGGFLVVWRNELDLVVGRQRDRHKRVNPAGVGGIPRPKVPPLLRACRAH